MQGVLIPLSFAVWIVVWVLVVKKRGRLNKLMANLIGAIAGLVVSTLFLNAVLPESAYIESQASRKVAEEAAPTSNQETDIPSEAIDRITLLYLNHKIYPDSTVFCEPKRLGGRDMLGCRGQKVGSVSQVHVWEYSNGKFRSINGNARTMAEGKFANENAVEATPLPLPSDINVGAVVEAFSKK